MNMDNYIQQHKKDAKKENQWREEINGFENSIDELYDQYDNGLRKYFRFYALLDAKGIDQELETSSMTINMHEFMKFGYQTDLIPTIIQKENFKHIFRVIARERDEDDDKKTTSAIDFEFFKKALIRISIMGRQTLGGNVEKRKPPPQRAGQNRGLSRMSRADGTEKNFNETRTNMRSRSRSRGGTRTQAEKEVDDLDKKKSKYDTTI